MIQARLTKDKAYTRLADLRPGLCGRVVGCTGLNGDPGRNTVFQRLCEMGFVCGASLRVVKYAPFGDPIQIQLEDTFLTLRKSEAALVEVEPS